MNEPLCLLSIHAHPDDEASKGAPTVAKYADEGIRGVLVTCTGGEEGDIQNDELKTPEIEENLHEVRLGELDNAVKIIGYEKLYLLGYRDSGMADSEANKRPDNFWNAPIEESAARFARILRAERPQVVITYGEDQKRYPHPDHLRTHDITAPAIEMAADPAFEPDGDQPWQVQKVYWSNGFTRGRLLAMHSWFIEQGEESPFEEWYSKIPDNADDGLTTEIECSAYLEIGREALRAHRTQIDPKGHWFRIPIEHMRERHPYEHFILASSLVGGPPTEGYETDLFEGLR